MARIVFTLEDGTELETELDADVITIGRHADSIVVLPSGSVSSHHATIKRRGESYYVQDLGTTNGTKLNGVEVEEAKLEDGDRVTFGDVAALVHLSEGTSRDLPPLVPLPVGPPANVSQAPARTGGGPPRAGDLRPVGPRPAPGRPGARAPKPYVRPPQFRDSGGCGRFFIFVVFLVLAFVVGLHVRHGVVTEGFLLKDIFMKYRSKPEQKPEEPGASPKPADPSKPADGATPAKPPVAGNGVSADGAPATSASKPTPAPASDSAPAPASSAPAMDSVN